MTFLTYFCSQEKYNQFFFPTYMTVNWKFHKGDQVWVNLRSPALRTKPFYKKQLPFHFSESFLSFHENNLAIRTKIEYNSVLFFIMVNNITIVWMLFVDQSLIRPPWWWSYGFMYVFPYKKVNAQWHIYIRHSSRILQTLDWRSN